MSHVVGVSVTIAEGAGLWISVSSTLLLTLLLVGAPDCDNISVGGAKI